MVAILGALMISTLHNQHVINKIAGALNAVTILLHLKDLKGGRAIDPGDTRTLSSGKRYLHQEPSGAGTVGKRVIAMTAFASGAVVLKTSKVTTT